VAASYRHLSAALAETYRELGVEAELTQRARGSADSGACYLHATQADLSLGAAKLSGSAQVWGGDAVLQHGSFVRTRDAEAEAEVFILGERGSDRLRTDTATLSDALEHLPSIDEIVRAASGAFERVLGIRLEPGCLTDQERLTAEALALEQVVSKAPRNL
jgi:lipoate-protein ligase A